MVVFIAAWTQDSIGLLNFLRRNEVRRGLVVLVGIVLMVLLSVTILFSEAFAKDIIPAPGIVLNVPEACPDYRDFRPFPPTVFDMNPDLRVVFIVQEGQRGENEFVIVLCVVQADPNAVFILAIVHSVVNMQDPEKSITKIYADKVWIETGEPSNVLVEVEKLPQDSDFYRGLNKKKLPIKRVI